MRLLFNCASFFCPRLLFEWCERWQKMRGGKTFKNECWNAISETERTIFYVTVEWEELNWTVFKMVFRKGFMWIDVLTWCLSLFLFIRRFMSPINHFTSQIDNFNKFNWIKTHKPPQFKIFLEIFREDS